MKRGVEKKLRNLARLTELVYRLEAGVAAELAQSQQVLVAGTEDACAVVDDVNSPSFLRELAITRAANLRGKSEASRDALEAQLAVAVGALARFKGAETLVECSAEAQAQDEAQLALEEAIDSSGAHCATRLEQAGKVIGR